MKEIVTTNRLYWWLADILGSTSTDTSEVLAVLIAQAYVATELWRDGHVQESVALQHEVKASAEKLLAAVLRESRQYPHLHEQVQVLARKILKHQRKQDETKTGEKSPT